MPHVISPKTAYTDKKPLFKCDHGDCKYSSSKPSKLRKHKRRKHPKKERNYENVELKNTQSGGLESHIRRHHNKKDSKGCKSKKSTSSELGDHIKRHCVSTKTYKCLYKDCNSIFPTPSAVMYHIKKHHIGAKPHKVDSKSCKSKKSIVSELEKHEPKIAIPSKLTDSELKKHESKITTPSKLTDSELKKHEPQITTPSHSDPLVSTKKIYKCKYADCGLYYSSYSHLEFHVRVHHTGEKPFGCDYKDCECKFAKYNHLEKHKQKHSYEKLTVYDIFGETEITHECKYATCGLKFSRYDRLKSHVRRFHTGETPFACCYKDCESKFATHSELIYHNLKHTGKKRYIEKKYKCDHENCEAKFAAPSLLEKHKRTHTGERPFACDICGSRFSQDSNLGIHRKTHTISGQIRRKTQENNLTKKLKEWGFSVDVETTINAKRGTCLNDTNRYYSRLDYHVINCTNAILLIECDEDQHSWYELSCEFSRMSDVRASLVTAGYELPIYWIRYNPNGKYHIGSKQVKLDRPKREIALKAKLEELCSPDFVPDKQVNIHYMFYDLMSEELGPEIMIESDFPEQLQDCVSCNEYLLVYPVQNQENTILLIWP